MNKAARRGNLRMICLVCGQEIDGYPQLVNGTARGVVTYREGQPAGTGYAHPACSPTAMLNLTGKPDYSDYEDDGSLPAFVAGYNAVKEGQAFDKAMRVKAARVAARRQETNPAA